MNIDKICEQLTIDEKIRLLGGVGDWHTYDCNGKIPSIMMTDGPHGIRKLEQEKVGDIETSKPATCFPTASAIACSWNPAIVKKMGEAIAKEAKKEQISIVLGCGINIKRSPLCGRNFEYFSEDPYLTGKLATGYIEGVQSLGIGTSLKHYAVNSQETRRMTSNSQIDERTLREIYLSAFEEVVKKAKPTSVMASYNRINGEFGARNKYLLTDVLRKEWKYQGGVVSDWGAANDIVSCMKNGLTLEMPDPKGFHTDVLKEAYKDGRITGQELDNWTKNVLQNFVSLHKNIEENYEVDMEEQNQVARKLENESAVLLKNNNVLPIGKEKKVIIIGELARQMRFQGGGSSHIQPTKMTNAIEAIREKGYQVTYIQGYQNETEELGEKQLQDTIEKLKQEYRKKDCVILYFIGLTESYEGEGYDRKNLKIPQNQEELLAEIAETVGKDHIAAISFGGAPMDFSFEKNVGAILHMYLGGQAVGESVADLISGEVNPSGKLAETIPFSEKDTPAWRYFAPPNDDVEYRESIFVGYRYYETFHVPVKYPFGYGLSYTSFSYSELNVPEVYSGGKIQIRFKIKNIGKVSGAEIAQLYICPIESDVIRSHIELKGFQKIYLHPGEEKEVILELDERSFSVYDVEKKAFSMLSGKYQICIGASVHDLQLKANMEVVGNSYFRNERELFPDYFREQPHGMEISAEQFYQLLGGEPKHDKEKKRGEYTVYDSYQDVVNVSMFLLTYIQYTMKLTVAQYAVISAIMVVCLLWDAINDPMMGIIIENSHLKAGKFKPWIFIGVILNSLIIICLFTVRPEGWGFVAFFGVGYLLWGMTYTMNDIAYWGMLPSLTSDPGERNWLVTVQGIFICIGQFSVAGLLPDMVAGNAIMAYRTAAIVIAFCFIGFQLLTVFGVKERKRPEKKRTLSLKDMFHIFLRNDQLIVIGIACLLFQIGNGLLIMIGMNFFYFEFGYSVGGSLVFWFTIMYGLGTLISEASFAWLSSKFTRNQIITAATIITVIGYMLFMSVGNILPKSVVLLNIIGFLIFFSQGAFNMTMIVMLNNTIEYDEVRFHERHDSIISAVRSFATKLASAVDQAVVALILIISNIYAISQKISGLEIKAGTGELTSENVIVQADKFIQTADAGQRFILRLGIVAVPVISIGAAYILIKRKYIIDERKYEELVAEIKSTNKK